MKTLKQEIGEVKRHSVTGYGRQDINYNDPEGEFVYYEDYAVLQQKLDAMAAEVDCLRNAIREHRESTHFCEVCGNDDPCETDDVCWVLKHELPVTEAYLNSVRAEGVDIFQEWLRNSADIFDKNGRHLWADKNRVAADKAKEFADSLRSGTHDTADKAG